MSSKYNESKTAAKRIVVGVLTAIVTTVTIYFLGFNRNPEKVTTIEIKKVTVKAWREFASLENATDVQYDSNLSRVRRLAITLDQYKNKDSTLAIEFLGKLEKIRDTKNLDKELKLFLDTRVSYKQQELQNFISYFERFKAINDSAISFQAKTYLIQELNEELNNKRTNFIERVGRNIETVAASLKKRYNYPFTIQDFTFSLYYQSLKKAKDRTAPPSEEPAPSDPNAGKDSVAP